jgi:hypothetical protein
MARHNLSPSEVERNRAALLAKLGLAADAAPPRVLYRIMELSALCGQASIDAPGFSLSDVFAEAHISPSATLYYWHGWDVMSAFDRQDLQASIQALWSPAPPEDVNVFDDSLAWLITIEHTGRVSCIKF